MLWWKEARSAAPTTIEGSEDSDSGEARLDRAGESDSMDLRLPPPSNTREIGGSGRKRRLLTSTRSATEGTDHSPVASASASGGFGGDREGR